jgi:hypothetical protein
MAKNALPSTLDAPKRERKRMMSDAEVITRLICFHFNPFRNFKHYYKPSHTTVLSRLCQDVLLCISRTRVNNKPLVTKQFLKQNKNTPIYLLFQNKALLLHPQFGV